MSEAVPTTEMERKDADPGDPVPPQRAWWWFGSIAIAVVLLVGLVWLAGGFEKRTDVRTIVAPGTTISTGPYEFTFDAMTVQKKKPLGDEIVWEVVAQGRGRVTGDQAMAPSTLDAFMVAQDPASGVVAEPDGQQFGPVDASSYGGSFFTPGLAAIPYRVVFHFPADTAQPTAVQLGVWQLEYRDTTLLQTGDLTWARSNDYYRYDHLPLTRLADDLD